MSSSTVYERSASRGMQKVYQREAENAVVVFRDRAKAIAAHAFHRDSAESQAVRDYQDGIVRALIEMQP